MSWFLHAGWQDIRRDNVGYRTALHMKDNDDKRPVWVIGGTSQDSWRVHGRRHCHNLGLGGQLHKGNFLERACHGGVITFRGCVEKTQVGGQVEISPLDEIDREILDPLLSPSSSSASQILP